MQLSYAVAFLAYFPAKQIINITKSTELILIGRGRGAHNT